MLHWMLSIYDCMVYFVPYKIRHFLHPWRSDAGGRATQELVAENNY